MAEQRRKHRRDDDPVRVHADHRVVWWTGGAPGLGTRRTRRCKTRAEAEAFAVETREVLADECVLDGTFADAARRYFEAHEESASASTVAKYRGVIAKWVEPEIGGVALTQLGTTDLARCFDRALTAGKGPSVIRSIDTAFGAVVTYAARLGDFGSRDPMPRTQRRDTKRQYVDEAARRAKAKVLKQGGRPARRQEARSPEQVAELADLLAEEFDGRGAHVVRLLAGSGLRWSELLGVDADAVDLDEFVVPVDYQALRGKEWRSLGELKDHEYRDVRVWPGAEESLKYLVEHAVDGCLLPPPVDYAHDWVARAERTMHAAMAQLGWPARTRTHALRHHFAVYSYSSPPVGRGMDLGRVSQMLGHSSPGYTARTYMPPVGGKVVWAW